MIPFVTAFDFGQFGWTYLLDPFFRLLIGVVVLGIAIQKLRMPPPPSADTTSALAPLFMIFWGSVWMMGHLVIAGTMIISYGTLHYAYTTHQYRIVEGRVQVHSIQPVGGHAPGDQIQIGDVSFEINQYANSPGYHQSIVNHGILTEGTVVRLWYYQGHILRIDRLQTSSGVP